ncbi:hypothetical protein CAPTEDRAFT_21476 [Capitella teleta]|uniref:Leucine carboxyl methyltransferase 1 n=1 Tax=Capitella teleta TaxID=283909 RepID=R7V5J9_CAPTE|nr:hypothetical protein CAPTEDRAFT_21476 [Capitella teleta]|eukprot:ELU14133.1 hypothetical protein CAPTEDRAFT_21476 [Capitella teleta]
MSEDDAVRATNDDATSCKRSAVQMSYWQDPYIQYFIRAGERKAPEINRGYYARVKGIQVLLKQFLELTKCNCQIINLGAGFDTTFWNLKDEGMAPVSFIEMDFQGVVNRKAYYIKNRKPLLDKLSSEDCEVHFNGSDLHSAQYHVVSADLRNLSELSSKLKDCAVDYTLPTVFIAECVLVYMPSESSSALLTWIAQNFQTAFFINYEQVVMGDRFGQVMVENLKSRGCILAGVEHCRSLETQKHRFLSAGWESAAAKDMLDIYKCLPQAEIQRLDGLELLNELHDQLLSHYCVCWAFVDRRGIGIPFPQMGL